ncbi:MAG: Na+/H+ antiporter subunit E [Candidatus Omnitrophota bacterium]|nr:MAG: Na+/H+ antiporter subunit E [Candidatus Omnitrophota bacterium]
MKSKIILFLVTFLVWCFLSWVPDFQHIIIGIVISAFVVFMMGDLFIGTPQLINQPQRYWYFIVDYVPVFLWECFKANLDVAYRVLHPRLPIKPGIVKAKTKLKTDAGLTFLANSITLTPGTMSVDIDKDNGCLYVHWINVKDADVKGATETIVRRFERILERIFE